MSAVYTKVASLLACVTLIAGAAARALEDDDPMEKEPQRLALVIGTPLYDHLDDIPSSAVDAQRVSAALQQLGFDVTEGTFTSRTELENALVAFRQEVAVGDLVLVYFSGHGFAHGPFNYLASTRLPRPVFDTDLLDSAVALEELEDFFACPRRKLGCRSPGLLVFIVDACRSFTKVHVKEKDGDEVVAKSVPEEPQPMNAATNVLFVFAARPGSTAAGTTAPDQPSTFTKYLVPVLGTEGKELEQVIDDAAATVIVETGTQFPGKVDWSNAMAFLRPTEDVVADELEAWRAAIGSGQRKRVEHFLILHAVSRYAAAARKWLEDHPQGVSAGGYTLAPPVAIERAWRPDSDERLAVRRTQLPLGFPRVMGPDAAEIVDLSDAELGLVPSGTTARELRRLTAGESRPPFHTVAIEAGSTAVLLREERGFVESATAGDPQGFEAIDVEAGTPLRLLSVERGGPNRMVVRAELPGIVWPVRLSLQWATPPEPLELGRSLREVAVLPSEGPFPDLAATATLENAIQQLHQGGTVVTWASLAVGKPRTEEDPENLASRVAHVRHVLNREGVDGRRVTAVLQADGIPQGSIRVRLFGYQKGG